MDAECPDNNKNETSDTIHSPSNSTCIPSQSDNYKMNEHQEDSNPEVSTPSPLQFPPLSLNLPIDTASTSTRICNAVASSPRSIKNLNKRDFRGETHLHLCARKGDLITCKKLIEEGADVNLADNAGWTPLHEACAYGFYEMVEFLLKNGADVNKTSSDGVCPLHDAVQSQNSKLVWLLLKHGANRNQQSLRGQLPADLNNGGVKDIDELLKMNSTPSIYPFDEKEVKKKSENKAEVVSPSGTNFESCSVENEKLDELSPPKDEKSAGVTKATSKKDSNAKKPQTKSTTSLNSSKFSPSRNRKRGGGGGLLTTAPHTGAHLPVSGSTASSSSVNDVYEFHSSPESNGAISPVSIIPPISVSVLQKSAQSSISPNNPAQLMNSSPNVFLTTAPIPSAVSPSALQPSSSTSNIPTNLNIKNPMEDATSQNSRNKLPLVTPSCSSTNSPAPKRIKTATLAKELLAAAAASASSPLYVPLNTNISVNNLPSTPTSSSAVVTSAPVLIKSIDEKLKNWLKFRKSEINDEIGPDVDNAIITDQIDDSIAIDDMQKRVPPLRILLPKTNDDENDAGGSNTTIQTEQLPCSTDGAETTMADNDCSSGSGSSTQSPMLNMEKITGETTDNLSSSKKTRRNILSDRQNVNEEQSQQRLTRSRVRQTGAVITDDITAYPTNTSHKRKSNNLRLRNTAKRDKNLTLSRELESADLDASVFDGDESKHYSSEYQSDGNSAAVVVAAAVAAAASALEDGNGGFIDLGDGDEECSRQSFDPSGKQEDDGDDDDETNDKEDEQNLKESAASALFSTNSFDASLDFSNAIKEKWVKEYCREIGQLQMDREEIANCIDGIAETFNLQKHQAFLNLQKQLLRENETQILLPQSLEKLHIEQKKRHNQLCKLQFEERKKLVEHGVREYFRISSTQQVRNSTFNVARLLRDSELYDPFALDLLKDCVNNNNNSSILTTVPSTTKYQIFKRLKGLSIMMKNRQVMEAHSLFVTQGAEWQKAVRKFNRHQQKQKQEEQQKKCADNNVLEALDKKINEQLANFIVPQIVVVEAEFPFPFPQEIG